MVNSLQQQQHLLHLVVLFVLFIIATHHRVAASEELLETLPEGESILFFINSFQIVSMHIYTFQMDYM